MRSSRRRGLGACFLAIAATASCSLLYDVQGFDSNYTDAGNDAHHDRVAPPDGPQESASPTMPLFHYRRLTTGARDAAVSTLQPGVAFLLDSGAAHAIGCPDKGSSQYFEPSMTFGLQALNNGPYRYGQFAMTSFQAPEAGLEVPPGQSRFAFTQVVPDADGGSDYPLLVADELTDCNGSHPTVRVDPTEDENNAGKLHVFPRFSPDGSRIAYLDVVPDSGSGTKPSVARLVTTRVDGKSPSVIMTAPPYDPKTNLILWGLPPTWLAGEPAAEVFWLEGPDPSCSLAHSGCASPPFEFNSAVDTNPPVYGTLVKCPYGSGGFSQIAELAIFYVVDDVYFAIVASSGTLSASPAAGAMDIYITDLGNLKYFKCSAFTNATHLGRKGAVARDMAVSPAGSLIAYASNAGPIADAGSADGGAPLDITSPTHIWLLSPTTDGSASPTPCGDPSATAFDDFGPQWFNDGKLLVWTRAAHPATVAPDTVGGLWQADVMSGACTSVRPVVSNGPTDDGALTVIAPANTTIACSVGVGGPRSDATTTAVATWGVALLLVGRAGRRRRLGCPVAAQTTRRRRPSSPSVS
jgi:WD40 repeat protein